MKLPYFVVRFRHRGKRWPVTKAMYGHDAEDRARRLITDLESDPSVAEVEQVDPERSS